MSVTLSSGARGSKDCHFWNIIMYKNGKVDSLQSLTRPKIHVISKNAFEKSCRALNSVQWSQWTYMSTSLWNEGRGTKDWYVSNIRLHWSGKVDLVWGSMLPKIRMIWEKASNKSCWELNSVQSPAAPPWREIDVCAHWLFCTEFNAQQLLFESFLDIMHIFGNVEA